MDAKSPFEITTKSNSRLLFWLALGVVALAALGLRLWNLEQNGFGNPYYAAAVRSMLASGSNFFFCSFDPAGFASVDKPPVAFWMQALSAKVFGFRGLSLLVPQAIAGVTTVLLVFYYVRKWHGLLAAVVAGVVLAAMPINVAVDRSNLVDSWLVLALTAAAIAGHRATRTGSVSSLLVCAAMIGVGFNIKMMVAIVLIPVLVTCFVATAPLTWPAKIGRVAVAGMVLIAVSFSWATIVELTPATKRPYVGGSQNNSAFNLIFGYNGIGRVLGGWGQVGATEADSTAETKVPQIGTSSTVATPTATNGSRAVNANASITKMPSSEPGLLRLVGHGVSDQFAWFLPLAIFGIVAMLRVPKVYASRAEGVVTCLLWGGWLLIYGVVFSFSRGTFHPYYLVVLGPPLAVLSGVGASTLVNALRERRRSLVVFLAALVLCGAWQTYLIREHRNPWPTLIVALWIAIGVTVWAMILVTFVRLDPVRKHALSAGFMLLAFAGLCAGPVAWATTVVRSPSPVLIPVTGPQVLRGTMLNRDGLPTEGIAELSAFLEKQHDHERYWLATMGATQASALIIRTGKPVISLGGFAGNDPILTLDSFKQLVSEGGLRFVMLAGMDHATGANRDIMNWVQANCASVDASEWQARQTVPAAQVASPSTDQSKEQFRKLMGTTSSVMPVAAMQTQILDCRDPLKSTP